MEIKNTLVVGHRKGERILVPWRNSNGLLIAGIPGTGKSTTASYYIHQYAYKGTKFIICDYNAALGTGETLLSRVNHLEDTFLYPPATTKKQIEDYIYQIQKIGDDRYSGRQTDHFPILFVIDEFPAFIYDYSPPQVTNTKVSGDKKSDEGETRITERAPDFIESLTSSLWKYRKVNIHFMLIGQDWAQAGTNGVRKLRSAITDRVIHRVDESQAAMFGFSTRIEQKYISSMSTGVAFYKGSTGDGLSIAIPEITEDFSNAVLTKIQEYAILRLEQKSSVWTQQEQVFLDEMIAKYQPKVSQRQRLQVLSELTITDKDELVRFLIQDLGKSLPWIKAAIKGDNNRLSQLYSLYSLDNVSTDNVSLPIEKEGN